MSIPSICVITFCVDRAAELSNCIRSVLGQTISLSIRHIILSERVDVLRQDPHLKDLRDMVVWYKLEGKPHTGHSSPRMARLRQYALSLVNEPFLCFLDDDNEFFPEHLMTLIETIEGGNLDAAYSWRKLCEIDGLPFTGDRYPWHPDPEVAVRLYDWCVKNGVITPGKAIVRDGPIEDPSLCNIATVDMNEWLFRTDRLRSIGFITHFTSEEIANMTGEDDKLLARMKEAQFKFAGTQLPTIRYRLGGVSNGSFSKTVTHRHDTVL